MAESKDLSDDEISKISKLHDIRNCFINLIMRENDKLTLKNISTIITNIDFQLQKIWKFDQDEIYHRFWDLPKCECPKVDNEDVYGTGHRYINPNCVFHGK